MVETDRYVLVMVDGVNVFHVVGTVTQAGREVDRGRSVVHKAGDKFPARELKDHLLQPLLDGEANAQFALVDPPDDDDEEQVDALEQDADVPGTGTHEGTGGTPNPEGVSPSSDDTAGGSHANPNADPEVSVNESTVEVPGTGEGSPGDPLVEPGSGQTAPAEEEGQAEPPSLEDGDSEQQPLYDPTDHNQDDVLAYLTTATADEVERVQAVEADHKKRAGIRDFQVAN